MRYTWLDAYLLSFPGVEKNYKPEWKWFRYQIRNKLFAAICAPGPEHGLYGGHELINLKCNPEKSELLQIKYPEILPGFYSNKRLWIACLLDGNLPDELLRDLCAKSYQLVKAKLPKYIQKELEE